MANDPKTNPTQSESQQRQKGPQDIQKKNPYQQGQDEQDEQQKGDKRRAS